MTSHTHLRTCRGTGWPTADVVTHVRLWDNGAAWNQVHLGVDVYDWSLLDQFVAQAQQVWPSVAFSYVISATPAWLADPDCMNDPVSLYESLLQFLALATAS